MNLKELQRQFLAAMYQGGQPLLDDSIIGQLSPQQRLSPEQQLAVYQGSVQGGLAGALADIFPRLKQGVGVRFFDALATRYVLEHPSRSHSLDDYGESFAEFCRNFGPLERVPYSVDLARIDWSWHRAFHSKNTQVLRVDSLLAMNEEQLNEQVVELHPSVHIIESKFPIYQIWNLCEQDCQALSSSNNSVDLNDGAESVLVWRQGLQTQVERLSPLEVRFLKCVKLNMPLGAVFEELLTNNPDCAVMQSFSRFLGLEIFTA